MKRTPASALAALLLPAALILAGCASTTNMRNSITGYSGQARDFQSAMSSGNSAKLQRTIDSLSTECQSPDRILYLQERGRMFSILKDRQASEADYQIASDVFEAERMKAVISASEAFFSASAIASNDMAIPYNGYGFEKVMLHNLQALNFILDRNYDFARIELNHADVEQQYSLEKHQKMIAQAEAQKQQQQIDLESANASVSQKLSTDMFGAGAVKNSFQNAFTFYLRGCLFEDSRDYDKALIEYKKALEIYPNNRFLAESAMRTARLNGSTRDAQNLVDAFGNALKGEPCPQGYGRLVVVYSAGFVKGRSSFEIPFLWDDNVLTLILPYYDMWDYSPAPELDVSVSGDGARTQTICNLDAMAVQSLKEDYLAIMVRQVLRMIAKYKMQKQAGDGAMGILMKVANLVTDNADDRNWRTLPQEVQVAELFVPAGKTTVSCSALSLSGNLDIEVKPEQTSFLVVTQLGQLLVMESGDEVVDETVASGSSSSAASE
jgi:hypothetical protein